MKLNVVDNVVDSNLTDNHIFHIEVNATVINILSGKIYSDEILAVIRELCCNAVDSHIEAGKPLKPIDVTLPTILDPHFIVRDYGVGMDEEFVYNVYGVYGKSNKRHTNDLTGALGLGSKSPFAYQDSFTIISVKDGIKSSYITSMNNGIPQVSCVGRKNTDECNGVTVKLTVKNNDIEKFVDKASEIFSVFGVHPNILGESNYKRRDLKLVSAFDDVYLVEKYYTYGKINFYALQSNVRYTINTDKLSGCEKQIEIIEKVAALNKADVYLYFDNGDVDFAASREELQYTERTLELVSTQITSFYDTMVAQIHAEIQSQPSYWDACITLNNKHFDATDLFNSDVPIKIDFKSLSMPYYYNGKKVKSLINFSIKPDKNIKVSTYHWKNGSLIAKNVDFELSGPNFGLRNYAIFCSADSIILNDMKSGFMAKLSHIYKIKNYGYNGRYPNNVFVIKADGRYKDIIKRMLGGVEVIKLSDVDVPKATKQFYSRPSQGVLLCEYSGELSRFQKPVEGTPDYKKDPGFYIVTERNDICSGMLLKTYKPYIKFFEKVSGKRAFYIRAKHQKMLEKYGWKPFDNVVRGYLVDIFSVLGYAKFFTYETDFYRHIIPDIQKKYDKMVLVVDKYGVSTTDIYRILDNIPFYMKSDKSVVNAKKHYEPYDPLPEVNEKYPLLPLLVSIHERNSDYSEKIEKIKKYIELVDKAEKQ